jgi:hypothetical protein
MHGILIRDVTRSCERSHCAIRVSDEPALPPDALVYNRDGDNISAAYVSQTATAILDCLSCGRTWLAASTSNAWRVPPRETTR